MNRPYKLGFILIIFCVIFIAVLFLSREDISGKWYLYNGNDIESDLDIISNLNSNNYIIINQNTIESVREDGKAGVASYVIKGNKIHVGDTIYSFNVKSLQSYKILFLKTLEYNNGHSSETIKNGEKLIYVLDEQL